MVRYLQAGLLTCALTASPVMAQEVVVAGGKVAGVAMADGSSIYYGIPYAASPAGKLRWQPPAPRSPWTGVLDGRQPAPACAQGDIGWNQNFIKTAQEDCLTISVRAPARAGTARLPVFVYIHGGSNAAAGAGSMADDAIHREGVVLARVQFRLGVFGFLGLDSLRKESPHQSSGNYALLDQIAALKWIKANIGAFGGDAANVTISGNSSGALDALLLTMSPLAKGLFHKAIIQAPAPGAPVLPQQYEELGKVLLDRLRLPNTADGLAQLRALPAASVLAAAANLRTPKGVDPSFLWEQQFVDGSVLPDAYADAYAKGAGRGIAVLIGSNRQELGADKKPESGAALIKAAFGADAPAALTLYGYRDGKAPADDRLLGSVPTQVFTDMWFRCPNSWLAEKMLRARGHVWRYEFGFGKYGSNKPPEHTSEMDYVYHAAPANALARDWPPLQRYWANFMRKGDPNGAGLPQWPKFSDRAAYLSLEPEAIKAAYGLRSAVCKLANQQGREPRWSVPLE